MSAEALRFRSNLDASDYEVLPVRAGQTINEWLDANDLRKLLHIKPTVVELNGSQICERDYDHVIEAGDHIALLELSQYGIDWVVVFWYAVAYVAVAALVLPAMGEPGLPDNADQKEGSPTYSTSVKGNRYRPDAKGSILYGTTRITPDFAQEPFSVYDAEGHQHLYLKFIITQGIALVDLDSVTFEDTPLTNFSDYEIEQLLPGQVSSLVPARVLISDEVSEIDLLDGITSAYVVCGVGDRVNRIEFDLASPRIFKQSRETGELTLHKVKVDCQAQEIDDSGAVLGEWVSLGVVTFSGDSQDAIRRSESFVVASGRYQVRIQRVTVKDDSAYVQDSMSWVGLKGYLQDDTTSDCTQVALVLRSSNQVGNRSLTNCSMIASRYLKTWSSESGWGGEVQTNHFAWALADLCRASYAGRRPDTHYKLSQLEAFAARSDLASAEFNAYFDTEGVSVWDAIERAGMPGRVRCVDYAGQYYFVRDEAQVVTVQAFSMRNIVQGSYSKKITGFVTESADSVIVKFRDKTADYQWYNDGDGLLCKVPESPGLNPREIMLYGVDDPVEAKKLGMWLAAQSAYRRITPSWSTGMEGRIPFFGSQVSLSHFILGYEGRPQVSGDVLAVYQQLSEVEVSEPVPDGLADPHIIFRNTAGQPMAAFSVQVVDGDPYRVKVLPIDDGGAGIYPDWSEIRVGESGLEDTQYALGDGPTFSDLVKVTKVTRNGDKFDFEGYVDDPRVYLLSEDVTPPDSYNPPGKESLIPVVRNLVATLAGTVDRPVIQLSWEGVNCDYYEIEISEDGIDYDPYGSKISEASVIIRPEPGHYYFKVYGYNILRGQPAVVDIQTSEVATAVPPDPTDLVLREAFTGPVLKLEWQSSTYRHLISVLVGGVEQYFVVHDGEQWDFSAALAAEYGIGRGFTVRVFSVGENTIVSDGYAELAVYNNPPALLNNLSVTGVGARGIIQFESPSDSDFSGVSVWMSDTDPVLINDDNKVIDKSFDPLLGVDIGRSEARYVIVAAEDVWGSEGLNYSAQYSVAGTLISSVEIGEYSILTPHLGAGAVTAEKALIDQLSALTADMGMVTGGTFKTSSGSIYRVEISSSGDFPLWVGQGLKTAENALMYIDKNTGKLVYKGDVELKSSSSGARLEISNEVIKVFDENGILRVRIGDLSA